MCIRDRVDIAGNSVPALLLVSNMRASYLASIPMIYGRATIKDEAKGAELEKQITEANQKLSLIHI